MMMLNGMSGEKMSKSILLTTEILNNLPQFTHNKYWTKNDWNTWKDGWEVEYWEHEYEPDKWFIINVNDFGKLLFGDNSYNIEISMKEWRRIEGKEYDEEKDGCGNIIIKFLNTLRQLQNIYKKVTGKKLIIGKKNANTKF